MSDSKQNEYWWDTKHEQISQILQKNATPLYIYDLETVKQKASLLFQKLTSVDRIYYAFKANDHAEILKALDQLNKDMSFECVSLQEIHHVLNLFPEKPRDLIFFTPNFCGKSEYEEALKLGVTVNVDCIFPLERWSDLFKGKSISIRIDSGKQHGHHEFVKTASFRSKFGISPMDIPKVAELCKTHNIKICGIHSHVGSGIFEPQVWANNAKFLYEMAALHFKDTVTFINIGGGLGVVENPQRDSPLDLDVVNDLITKVKQEHGSAQIQIHMEPGRFFVSEAGVLVTSVTQIKQKEQDKWYIGCDSGFNCLLRPALYSSWHQIVNFSRRRSDEATITADVVGQICESGDVLGRDREFPKSTDSGDFLVIGTAGAYGATMALSAYNLRKPAQEIILN